MKGRVNNPLLLSDLSKALAYAIDGRLVQAVDITQTSVTSDYPLTYEQVLTVFFTITGYNEGTYFRAIMNGETQDFVFPKSYTYPPMWSMQRVGATRERQYKRWSGIILAYCRNARIWRFRLVEMLDTPLFHNKELKEWLSLQEVRDIVDWMSREEGLKRAEWIGNGSDKSVAWIYWRRPDEWAEIIWKWVSQLRFQKLAAHEGQGGGKRTEEHRVHVI